MDSGRTSSARDEVLNSDEELTEDTPSTASKRKIRRWTDEEHDMLVKLVEEFGEDACWATIAEHIPGRTGKQCRERWVNHIGSDIRKGGWTAGEEEHMATLHAQLGQQWTKIASALGGRTENSVKNHFNALLRSKRLDDKRTSVLAQYVRLCRDKPGPAGPGIDGYNEALRLASQAAQELNTCITSSQPSSRKQTTSIISNGSQGQAKTTAAKQARSGSVNPGVMKLKSIRTGRANSGSLGQKLSQNSQGANAATPMSRPILGDAVALVSRSHVPAGRFENGSESAPKLHGSGRLAFSSGADDCHEWCEPSTPISTLSHHHSKAGESNATLSHGTYTTPTTPVEGIAAKRAINKATRVAAKQSASQTTPAGLLGAMDLVASYSASLPPVQGVTAGVGIPNGVVQVSDNNTPPPANNLHVPLPEADGNPTDQRSVWEVNQSVLPNLSWKDSFGVGLSMGLSWAPDTTTHTYNKAATTNQPAGYANEPQGAAQVQRPAAVDLTALQTPAFGNPAANPAASSLNLGTAELPEHAGFASAFGNQTGVDFGSPRKTAATANQGLAGPVLSMLPTLASYDMFGIVASDGNDALTGRISGLTLEALLGASPMAGQTPDAASLYFSQGRDALGMQSDQAQVFFTNTNKSSGGGALLQSLASSFGGAKPLGHRSSIDLICTNVRPATIMEDFGILPSRPLQVKTRFGSAGGVGSLTTDSLSFPPNPVSKPPSVAGMDGSAHQIGDVYLTWKQENCPPAGGAGAPNAQMQGDNRRAQPMVSLGGSAMVPLGMVSAYPTASERGMLDMLPEIDVPPADMIGVLDILFDEEPVQHNRPPQRQSMGGFMQGSGRWQPPAAPHRQGSMHEAGMPHGNQQQAIGMDIHNTSMHIETGTRQQAGLSQPKIPLPPADLTIALSPGQASKRGASQVFGDAYSPGHSASKKSNYIGSPGIGAQQQQYSMESSGTQHPISVHSSPVMPNSVSCNGLPVPTGQFKGGMFDQMLQRKANLASQLLQGTGAMLPKEEDMMGMYPSRSKLMTSNGANWGSLGWGGAQFGMPGATTAPSASLAQ